MAEAMAASGFSFDAASLANLLPTGAGEESDNSSDYGLPADGLSSVADDATEYGGGSPSSKQQVLAPAVELELARLQSEHNLSMMKMRHEREIADLQSGIRQRDKALRREIKLRDKALQAIARERDELTSRLGETELERARLADQLAIGHASNATLTEELTRVRSQAGADKSGAEARAAAQQQRLEEATKRAEAAEKANTELRLQLEASQLGRQDAERTASESQTAIQSAWRDLGSANAAKELLGARLKMVEKELERIDLHSQRNAAIVREREAELREAAAALAATREQRNQAAREAEASRHLTEEAADDRQRAADMVQASEMRIAAAERKAVQEAMGRERAEKRAEAVVLAQHKARGGRQRKMLALLIRVTRALRALAFSRWLAFAAATGEEAARNDARISAREAKASRAETRDAWAAIEAKDGAALRAASVGGAFQSLLSGWLTKRHAAVSLARWAAAARCIERVVARWETLVRGIERHVPTLRRRGCGRPSNGCPWRLMLSQRADGQRRLHKRAFWRLHRGGGLCYDSGRVRRAIFVLWRMWARSEALYEEGAIAQANRQGLHVASQVSERPWWEATD